MSPFRTTLALALLFLILCGTGQDATAVVGDGPDPRPNFVVILTDDQEPSTIDYMPRVRDLLVEQGVRFSNAFVPVTACCPSRVSLLRGQYSHNHGVLLNKG